MRRVLVPRAIGPLAPEAGNVVVALHGETMGTTWSVSLVAHDDGGLDGLKREIAGELDDIVGQMSTWEPDSVISRFNRAPAGAWIDVPQKFLFVLNHAIEVARLSSGAYDPTSGPLVNAWGFGPEGPRRQRPNPEEIERARARVGWSRLEIDFDERRVLQPGGVYLDFSAIAKGYGVDRVSRCLRRAGFDNHLVEIGGELRGAGLKPDALPWWVELERPPSADDASMATLTQHIVALHGFSVATSGDYRRCFVDGTERFGHTLDPRTGEPVRDGIASVTVIHPECISADAVSTALYVLGTENGLDFANGHDIPALFVARTEDGFREHTSDQFEAMLQ